MRQRTVRSARAGQGRCRFAPLARLGHQYYFVTSASPPPASSSFSSHTFIGLPTLKRHFLFILTTKLGLMPPESLQQLGRDRCTPCRTHPPAYLSDCTHGPSAATPLRPALVPPPPPSYPGSGVMPRMGSRRLLPRNTLC